MPAGCSISSCISFGRNIPASSALSTTAASFVDGPLSPAAPPVHFPLSSRLTSQIMPAGTAMRSGVPLCALAALPPCVETPRFDIVACVARPHVRLAGELTGVPHETGDTAMLRLAPFSNTSKHPLCHRRTVSGMQSNRTL